MIKLGLPTEPYWMNLIDGVRLFVVPCDTILYQAARAKSVRLGRELAVDWREKRAAGIEVDNLSDLDISAGLSDFYFARELMLSALREWEGVLDQSGSAASVNEENVSDLMRIPGLANLFLDKYSQPYEAVIVEGNA